jgi:diphthine synthase
MSINTAVAQLLEVEDTRGGGVCGPTALAIGVARVGQETQCIVSGTLKELEDVDFGAPLHSLVVVGHMHELEQALFDHFRVKADTPRLPPAPEEDDDSGNSTSGDEGASGAGAGRP